MATVNRALLQDALAALEKMSFVPAGDPNMTGVMPQGMDPAAMGGGMPPGMDPAAMGGGMPPGMDPAAMGGGMPPMDPLAMLQPMITEAVQQAVQQAMATQNGGGTGTAKSKANVAAELHQMKMMLARLMDVLGVPLSAAEMFADPTEPPPPSAATAQPAADPAAAGGGGLGRVTPMKAAADGFDYEYGQVFEPATFQKASAETFFSTAERARAILMKSQNV